MIFADTHKKIAVFILSVLLATQALFIANVLILPKPANAQFATATTIIADIYADVTKVAEGALKRVALIFADKFLTEFTNQVVNKYQIRNYLYYDQVLSDYYLTNYIRDKISDPDLQKAMLLLDSAYVAGNTTYTDTGISPQQAIVPQLKKQINDMYIKAGGVDPNLVQNPPANMSDFTYNTYLYDFYLNPQEGTANNILSQYSSITGSSSTAAQLEIITGNGYKSGRTNDLTGAGGTCNVVADNTPGAPDPNLTQANCEADGGKWSPSLLTQARTLINNPAAKVNSELSGAIDQLFGINYNPNDSIWASLGSVLGDFLYNNLSLNSSGGTLVGDGGSTYQPTTSPATAKGFDIDGDGIFDAYDYNGSGILDVGDGCVFQGVAPNCTGSKAATTPPTSGGGGERPPCTQLGFQEQQFILPLLNAIPVPTTDQFNADGSPPQAYQDLVQTIVEQTNNEFISQMQAAGETAADYRDYVSSDVIGFVEFYLAGPTADGSVTNWGPVPACPADSPAP